MGNEIPKIYYTKILNINNNNKDYLASYGDCDVILEITQIYINLEI